MWYLHNPPNLTVPLPKHFVTWRRNLGTEAITTSGSQQLPLTWGTSRTRNQGFWVLDKCPPHMVQLSPNPNLRSLTQQVFIDCLQGARRCFEDTMTQGPVLGFSLDLP